MTEGASPADSQNPIRRIGVLGRSRHEDLPGCLQRLSDFASGRGIELFVETHLLPDVPDGTASLDLERESVDLLVALGGDGTLLRAGRLAAGRDVPVLGINIGHLGFLTAVPLVEMEARVGRVLDGDYVLDRLATLEARVIHADGSCGEPLLAWNDFVLHKSGVARVTRLDMRVGEGEDWKEVGSFSGDGLIIATPTGSTAYSLSAGGPIVVPSVDCLILTPICPHTLAVRPLVVPGDHTVAVRALERTEDLVITMDGQVAQELDAGDEVRVNRSDVQIPLIRFSDQNFFRTLQRKLNWAARPSG